MDGACKGRARHDGSWCAAVVDVVLAWCWRCIVLPSKQNMLLLVRTFHTARAGAVDHEALTGYRLLDHTPFDPTVKRTESLVVNARGEQYRVTKGAPHVVLQLVGDAQGLHARVQHEVRLRL